MSPQLYPFQEDGVRALTSRPAVLLADDMGLGKTVQAAAAMARLAERGELLRSVVIAPRGLLGQWRSALDQWAPALSAIRVDGDAEERAWRWRAPKNVFLVGYEAARNDLGVLRARPWDLVVLDEAQRIKNRDVELSRAVKRIPRTRAWALTGTPLENRADDLASILEFVAPNPDGVPPRPLRVGPALAMRQGELQLRRRKEDVLTDLPLKTVVRVELTLEHEQRRSYLSVEGSARDRLRALGDGASVMNVLEEITRLKQICNFCPGTGRSAKEDDLVPRLEEILASHHSALVFSQWTNERVGVRRIAAGIRHLRPLVYTGDMGLDEREGVVRRFMEDAEPRPLVLSLRAGGQGLNLQRASYVVHFDRWWNPAVEDQATDRSHRAGQTSPVTVYEYVCVGTIEERIEALLDGKRALFRTLVDGVSMDLSRTLSPDELFGLFGLRAPARLQGAGAAPEERAAELLRATGWSVSESRSTQPVVLRAQRSDELGRGVTLAIGVSGEDQIGSLERLRHALASTPVARGILIVTAEPSEELADAAERFGIELWRMSSADERPEGALSSA